MFGELIKKRRIEKKLSINGLANSLGISPSYLMRLEKEENNNPSVKIALSICKELNISKKEMLSCYDDSIILDNVSDNKNIRNINNIINSINNKNKIEISDIINIFKEVGDSIQIENEKYIIITGKISYVVRVHEDEFDLIDTVKESFDYRGYMNFIVCEGKVEADKIYSVKEILALLASGKVVNE